MAVGRRWMIEQLGADVPASVTEASSDPGLVAGAPAPDRADVTRELIDFDSEAPPEVNAGFVAAAPKGPPSLEAMLPIPWPDGLAPRPAEAAAEGESLPAADVLIVTWTTDEGSALSRVLTPGYDSRIGTATHPIAPGTTSWKVYTKNFSALAPRMRPMSPARGAGRLGTYWTTVIGERTVTLFKSDSHMSQDGPSRTPQKTINREVWAQIIADVQPQLVITTGTGGGIGPESVVGDVVVSRFVTFDPTRSEPHPALEFFACPSDPPAGRLTSLDALLGPNARFLPGGPDARAPRVALASDAAHGVLTTELFAYDDSNNTDHLQGFGTLCEMGDAVLGLVCQELGEGAPRYVAVRNVSDPQIDASDGTPQQQVARAVMIYQQYGKWSSVCSAIVCWAIVAAL